MRCCVYCTCRCSNTCVLLLLTTKISSNKDWKHCRIISLLLVKQRPCWWRLRMSSTFQFCCSLPSAWWVLPTLVLCLSHYWFQHLQGALVGMRWMRRAGFSSLASQWVITLSDSLLTYGLQSVQQFASRMEPGKGRVWKTHKSRLQGKRKINLLLLWAKLMRIILPDSP